MAEFNRRCAAALDDYPASQRHAEENAERFAAGAAQIAAGTHPNQLSGEWT